MPPSLAGEGGARRASDGRGAARPSAVLPRDALAFARRRPALRGDGLAAGRSGLGVCRLRPRRLPAARRAYMDDLPVCAGLGVRQPGARPRLCMVPNIPARRRHGPAARGWSGDDRSGIGLRAAGMGAALERSAFVAEIIRHVARRAEVLRPWRRLDGVCRRTRHGDGKRGAEGERQTAKAPGEAHRSPSFHSARLIRSIRKRSLVRAYQPRPCMRPTRRILSVAT